MEHPAFGPAEWIWNTDNVSYAHPVTFTATRTFEISQPVTRARATIFVDRFYRLFLDGKLVGWGTCEAGRRADAYDLSTRFPRGTHLLAITAASPTGIGAILFSLELSGYGRYAVVSDSQWRVNGKPAWVWGRPPAYPWGFPPLASFESAWRAAAQ